MLAGAPCCTICARMLGAPGNPIAADCGGDCWGCIGEIEAATGWPLSVALVDEEILQGWRHADGRAKRPDELRAEGRSGGEPFR